MKRNENESFEDYKKRRTEEKKQIENSKKGIVIWSSGTFVKSLLTFAEKAGELIANKK